MQMLSTNERLALFEAMEKLENDVKLKNIINNVVITNGALLISFKNYEFNLFHIYLPIHTEHHYVSGDVDFKNKFNDEINYIINLVDTIALKNNINTTKKKQGVLNE